MLLLPGNCSRTELLNSLFFAQEVRSNLVFIFRAVAPVGNVLVDLNSDVTGSHGKHTLKFLLMTEERSRWREYESPPLA